VGVLFKKDLLQKVSMDTTKSFLTILSKNFQTKGPKKLLLIDKKWWQKYHFLPQNIFLQNDPTGTYNAVSTTPPKIHRGKVKKVSFNVRRWKKNIRFLKKLSLKSSYGLQKSVLTNLTWIFTQKTEKFSSIYEKDKETILFFQKQNVFLKLILWTLRMKFQNPG